MEDGGFFDLIQFIQKPVVMDTFVDILLCAVPIWLAVMIGLLIGWSWRPRWTGLIYLGFRSKFRFLLTAAASIFCARRLWFAFTALSAFSLMRTLWSYLRGKEKQSEGASSAASSAFDVCHESAQREHDIVTENDLDHLLHILNKDAEISWQSMMERTTPSMKYQAWRHDPENGPTVYRSRTVFEDATAELVRDFFWDDEFRPKWDPMLIYFKILEECPHTGASVVHWIKKFPFFCSDREYIIGRRIWEAGKIYYCITKGVPYSSMPNCDKPRRVERYFSSWVIKPVESRKGDGQLSACEVNLIHYEDMGIPKDVAKLGVRHGMWGTVKKLHSGMRAYQNTRKSDVSLSRSAILAKITTNISFDGGDDALNEIDEDRQRQGIDWKWVIIGGTVAVACGLRTGLIGKALLIGAGREIMKR